MRVGIIAYLLHAGGDYRAAGVSIYTHQLLLHLPQTAPQHSYVAFHGADAPQITGVRSTVSPLPTLHPLPRIVWEQTGLPVQMEAERIDVAHGAVNVLPLALRKPSVVTVHDLSFLRFPQLFSPAKARYLRLAVSQSVRRATRVIAVSAHTRNDLVELLDVEPNRISVVPSGVDSRFHPLEPDEVERFRQSVCNARPYILHVGTLEPRKNIDLLIRAFAGLREELGLPHLLALSGARGWMYQHLFDLVRERELQNHVRFLDYVPPADLALWYNGADLFVYPSAYEGFGFPVLEAMACGAPVITSASSALQELAGDACLTIDPGSEEALRMAMARVLTDTDLARTLQRAGFERAAQFTWERTARSTASVYEQALGAARG